MSHRKGKNKQKISSAWQWDADCEQWFWVGTNPWGQEQTFYYQEPQITSSQPQQAHTVETTPQTQESASNHYQHSAHTEIHSSAHQTSTAGSATPSNYSFGQTYGTSINGYGGVNDLVEDMGNLSMSNASSQTYSYATDVNTNGGITDGPGWEYIVEGSRFFTVGRVFKCVWAEPAGQVDYASKSKEGANFVSKVRYFVVVREQTGCSVCLAMNTYGRQGTAKLGAKPEDHAAVYKQGGPGPDMRGETLSKESFPIIVEVSETIDPKSRINFNKPYTVEHNIKIMNVGRIAPKFLDLLKQYFDQSFGFGGHIDSEQESTKGFKVRNYDYKKFFRPGRVFKTLWIDQVGTSTNNVSYTTRGNSSVRTFLVVKQADYSCTCLPVTTYNGLGHRKRGINLSEHGIIYSGSRSPKQPSGISKSPLKVGLSKGAERLADNSLVNYGRVYTIETNAEVKDIGDLDISSRGLMRQYFNEVIQVRDDSDGYATAPVASSSTPTVDPSYYSSKSTDYQRSEAYTANPAPISNTASTDASNYGYGGPTTVPEIGNSYNITYGSTVASSGHNPTAYHAYPQHSTHSQYAESIPYAPSSYAPDEPSVYKSRQPSYTASYEPEAHVEAKDNGDNEIDLPRLPRENRNQRRRPVWY